LATAAVENGRYFIDVEFCPLDDGAPAEVIELSLNPLPLQIAEGAYLQSDRDYSFYATLYGMFLDDLKYAFRYRKLVHLPPSSITERLLLPDFH
jgi:hypothetical protein